MKKTFLLFSALTISALFISCDGKKANQTIQAPDGMVALDLSRFGKQFSLFVPDTVAAKLVVVEQSWGALEVSVGKSFHVSITEDPGDMELRKNDIKANDVNIFKSFIIDEPTSILWESEIVKPEYHFYSIKKVGANNYVFEDVMSADGEPFSKDAVQKMFDSAKNIVEKVKPEA